MRSFHHSSQRYRRYRLLKVVVWVVLIAASPLSALGASPKPLIVVNPFVPTEAFSKIRGMAEIGKPVLVLNPYVEPLTFGRNSPYLRAALSPQVVFPAKQTK